MPEDFDSSGERSTAFPPDQAESLDLYSDLLRHDPISPRQWLSENSHIDPSPDFRDMLWSHYVLAYPPPRVPGFAIEDVLGEGGMGRVYLARDKTLNRPVAIKELTEALRRGDANAERFRSEAQILARLEHPNIVKIHQLIAHEGREFIAMEYLSNGTLADRLGTTSDLYATIPRIVARLARAIDYAHGERIIHRDLKLSNILFDKNDEPKVSDFGLAKDLDDSSERSRGAVLGTHQYMSPEQIEAKVVPGTDIWALGVILFRLFTGQFPFEGPTVSELHRAIRTAKPNPLPARIPAELRRICLKCLERDPKLRYLRGNELAEDLERAVPLPSSKISLKLRPFALPATVGVAILLALAAVPSILRRAHPVATTVPVTMRETLPGPTQSIAFTSDGRFGMSEVAGAKLIVWDLKKGRRVESVEHGLARDGECGSVAASPDGEVIAALGTNAVMDQGTLSFFELLDAKTFKKLPTDPFSGHSYGHSISFSPEGTRVALETFQRGVLAAAILGGKGGSRLSIYDIPSSRWTYIAVPAPITCSAFSPDGNLVLTGGNEPAIRVWDLAHRDKSRAIVVPDSGVDAACFSEDGSRLFAASIGEDSLSVYALSGEREKNVATTEMTSAKMSCAAVNPGGVAVTGHRDGTVIAWNLRSGAGYLFPRENGEIVAIAISRDGRKALAAFSDRSVRYYDLRDVSR